MMPYQQLRRVLFLPAFVLALAAPPEAFGQNSNPPGTQAPKKKDRERPGADKVPAGQELVNIDFPEPTDIKDIIRAVALWTGKNVILGKGVNGKVQMISPRKVTKEEAYQAFLSTLNVLGLTTVETGKVIKILPVRNAVKGNLQIYQGSAWAPRTDKMITQIVPLKYIDAKKIKTTLSRIVSTNSMITYEPTNTLIISDTGYKVRRILAIIELLDVQGQQAQMALVPIRYADAKIVAQKVGEILKVSTQGKGSSSGFRAYKITVDERSNSVVIFGPPRTISDVKALVKQFDTVVDDPANQAAIRVRFLNYADAKKLASTLSSLAAGNTRRNTRTIGRARPTSKNKRKTTTEAAAVADLGDNVKITADESSNALLITGSRSAYEAINGLVRKLDQRRAQVYVEVDILDVKIDGGFSFGTSIFAGQGNEDGSGTKISYGWQGGGIAPLMVAAATQDADGNPSTEAATGAIGALGSDFTIGVLSGTTVRIPGLGDVSPGALITMIKKDTNTRVLSSPHLLTSNNEVAKIVVGQKIFYQSATQNALGASGAVPKVEKEDVDLTLEIKPNISHTGNYLTLKIDLEANEGGIRQTASGEVPDVNKRQTSQIVTLKNGQTAVISGLVRLNESESYNKIPLLGDIPILGWLFRNSSLSKTKNSLMFFITPHIVYGANDLAAIYEKKVKERDELMMVDFDADEDDEFLKRLPKVADGRYRPDAFDELESRQRNKLLEEMRRDMGYNPEDMVTIEQDLQRGNIALPPAEEPEEPEEPAEERKQPQPDIKPESAVPQEKEEQKVDAPAPPLPDADPIEGGGEED